MLAATFVAMLFVPMFYRLMTRERKPAEATTAAQPNEPVPAPMASAAET